MGRDFMIITQLLKIRVSELQLRRSLKDGGSVAARLWSNLAELKSRVDVLDGTLNRGVCEQRAHFEPAGEGVWC
jgi:hypothetical protein